MKKEEYEKKKEFEVRKGRKKIEEEKRPKN